MGLRYRNERLLKENLSLRYPTRKGTNQHKVLNRQVPLLTRGKVYSSCVRSVMLHAAETWAMKADTLNRLRRYDRAMIRWICNVKAKDEVS